MVAIGRRLRKLWPLWVVLAALLAVLLVLFLPPLLIAPYGLKDPDKRLAAESAMRTTLAATFGGLAVIAGAIVGALNFRETSRQNRATAEQNRAVLELQRRGQVTERFSKAIEQLGQSGPDKLDIRIGAVYALEQIAQDSPELHWPIMEVLTAYLREHSRRKPADANERDKDISGAASARTPADVHAIATVIRRRRHGQDPPHQYLDLQGVDLGGANLKGVDLQGANLKGVDLKEANLYGAQLEEARLDTAQLTGANLIAAQLKLANLLGAQLEGAYLAGAQLEGAYLEDAHLKGAHLFEANLAEASLDGVDFADADLTDARNLTWEQLRFARNVDRATLPVYLTVSARADNLRPGAIAVTEEPRLDATGDEQTSPGS